MKHLFIVLITVCIVISACIDSNQSLIDPMQDNNRNSGYLPDTAGYAGYTEICHDNMRSISEACIIFYGANNRYPYNLLELEVISPGVSSLECPACNTVYGYEALSSGDSYIINCPMPEDPNHGYILDGIYSWNPDPSEFSGICHSNMRTLATGCAMFYGCNSRYPEKLCELEEVMLNWDLECPACGSVYEYESLSSGDSYIINCPMPEDPNHGYILDGIYSWNPDPSEFTGICRSNLRSLFSGCAMFYGTYNRYPKELSELGTSGVMSNWDLECPACGCTYEYEVLSSGTSCIIGCPMPLDPSHGSIADGCISWE